METALYYSLALKSIPKRPSEVVSATLGPVLRKMVKFKPGVRFSCLRTCNLRLQNTINHLLRNTNNTTC